MVVVCPAIVAGNGSYLGDGFAGGGAGFLAGGGAGPAWPLPKGAGRERSSSGSQVQTRERVMVVLLSVMTSFSRMRYTAVEFAGAFNRLKVEVWVCCRLSVSSGVRFASVIWQRSVVSKTTSIRSRSIFSTTKSCCEAAPLSSVVS